MMDDADSLCEMIIIQALTQAAEYRTRVHYSPNQQGAAEQMQTDGSDTDTDAPEIPLVRS